MKTVNLSDLLRDPTTYFDAVKNGATVRVLRHGKPLADIVPVAACCTLPSWKERRPKLRLEGLSLSDEILRDRAQSP